MKLNVLSLAIASTLTTFHLAHADFSHEKVMIGQAQSRGIWTDPSSVTIPLKVPAVILITGTGAHEPQEMMPGSVTADGKDAPLFDQFSLPLNQAGIATLELGKPGVEFFSSWNPATWFYDENLYLNLKWQDILDNVGEAVSYIRSQPGVDPSRVYILGHSEGTQVAADYAKHDPSIAGIILLGYSAESLGETARWQLFKEPVENWIAPAVDANHDGYVSKEEAAKWPEFVWDWKPGQERISLAEISKSLKKNPASITEYKKTAATPLYSDGIWDRKPLYDQVASLNQSVAIFGGELDQNCPIVESIKQGLICQEFQKFNCTVTVVPGLGHGFSPPKAPRGQPYVDATLGPVNPSFQKILFRFGSEMLWSR